MLAVLAERADRSGIFLDFDGTLSEIAAIPDAAVAVKGAADTLERLASRFLLVAVVTGRPVAEVEARLSAPRGVRFFGLYGRESDGAEDVQSPSRAVETALPRVLELAAGIPGSLVEPKGLNLAIHYRLSDDPAAARSRLLSELAPMAEALGMRLIEGKRVLELVPSASPSKGDVVRREGVGMEAVLYAGDDIADLSAFEAVDQLSKAGVRGLKVAVSGAETPRFLIEAADMAVEGPAGLLSMLRALAG